MSVLHEALCFICDESLSVGEITLVKERGVNRLCESSAQRGIPEHVLLLKNLTQVRVHTACQKQYNNEKLIAAFKRRDGVPRSVPSPSLRSSGQSFSFKDHCFLCGEEVQKDFLEQQKKLPMSRRESVHLVRKLAMKDTVLKAAEARGDEWAQEVVKRLSQLSHGTDLVAADGLYHGSCYKKLYQKQFTGVKRGHRPATNVDEAMEFIFSYLNENSDECQFSIDHLVNQIEGDFRPDLRTIKVRLQKQYGGDIIIADMGQQSPVVCFKNTGYKILSDKWYQDRNANPEEERLRVVRAAADIILEDIRSQVYNTSEYPPSDDFFRDVETVIPPSVLHFFEIVICKGKRGAFGKLKKTCVALSHSLMAAARPRSFLSSLLTGIGGYLYKKFGSRHLVNLLSSVGFSASYSEVSRFEASAIVHPDISIKDHAFCQFVFDNADFNVNTLDGIGTFHAMGGITSVTPSNCVAPDQNIQRVAKLSSTQLVQKSGSVPLKMFHKRKNSGLETINIQDIECNHPSSNETVPSPTDIVWLYGKWSMCPSMPGWNGFMEQVTADQSFETSKILCMPFINFPPSHYDTVLTSLLEAIERCRSLQQQSCIVTLDQPLYLKAHDIVSSGQDPRLNIVIVRLGGFHLMSFMGSIGFIMAGSGLKELFTSIYAENSAEKLMSGHAYSRAVRAHILAHRALAKFIFDDIQFTDEERAAMNVMVLDMKRSMIRTAQDNPYIQTVSSKFCGVLTKLGNNGPTAKLWVQYFWMTTLMKQFIEAERTGNWHLHLNTVQKMIPYFHAAGHFNYAKSAQLYLQDMLTLEEKMDPIECHKFTAERYFTIRRSDKFWSGIWSDLTIEQTLMQTMKSSGGLTRGRGITESVLIRWTLGMVYLQNVCDEVEKYCDTVSATSEQHVDMRPSRISRDDEDVNKLIQWFSSHHPFPDINEILSISSGVVGGGEVNCHLSQEIGTKGMSRIANGNFGSVHFKRKDTVVSLATVTNSIKIKDAKVAIDPLVLFHRICIAKQSDDELKEYFQYELAPFPLSIFSEEGMRKGTKSTFYSAFTPLPKDTILGKKKAEIVDGGYLLHKVHWDRNQCFSAIFKKYVRYVQHHHGGNATAVFDGYPTEVNQRSTKSAERARRSRIQASAEVMFDETMFPQMPQEKLLGNEKNKSCFISMLRSEFEQAQMITKQAAEDADVLIIRTAISLSSEYDAVIVTGEDIDLLVLLTALAPENTYLRKAGRGKLTDVLYSNKCFKHKEVVQHILFLHAISGCDTTSALFSQGKMKFCATLQKHPSLIERVRIFQDPDADREKVIEATECFLAALYGGDLNSNLDELRYIRFARAATTSKLNLARLPPSRDAAQWHAFRTYLQVQAWIGNVKNPLHWGWKRDSCGLTPVTMMNEPAPQALLNFISCQCKKGCGGKCSCRKVGLRCSIICVYCNNQSCENEPDITMDNDDNYNDHEENELCDEIEKDDTFIQPGPSKRQKL